MSLYHYKNGTGFRQGRILKSDFIFLEGNNQTCKTMEIDDYIRGQPGTYQII